MKRLLTVVVIFVMVVTAVLAAQSQSTRLSIIDLGTLGGDFSVASAINARDQVAGYSRLASGATHAFLWEDGRMTDLGTLSGVDSLAFGINARGQVVGTSNTASGDSHGFL